MRILFLNHNVVNGGGTFYRAFHVARYLVKRGHSVTLLTISPRNVWGFSREIRNGVEIVQTPDVLPGVGRTGWDPWDALNRIVYLRNNTWDVVHGWDCRPVVILPALYAASQSRASGKLFLDWCDWWGRGGTQAERPHNFSRHLYGPVETFFEEAFRRQAQGTTVASAALRDRACNLGVPRESILTLYGGCDSTAIQPMETMAARNEIGLPTSGLYIGCMGALAVADAELLINSVRMARQKFPGLRLLAIGLSVAGSKMPIRRALGLDHDDWIVETGRIPFDRVSYYLNSCDVLALPLKNTLSNTARWPSKINDYFAAGRPIVATNVGEVQMFSEQAYLTADNADSFRDGIVHLLSDKEVASRFSHAARTIAEGNLNWSQIVGRLEHFYSTLQS